MKFALLTAILFGTIACTSRGVKYESSVATSALGAVDRMPSGGTDGMRSGGTDVGGGGNAALAPLVGAERIKETLTQVQKILPEIFYELEWVYDDYMPDTPPRDGRGLGAKPPDIFYKLFPSEGGSKEIYAILKRVQFQPIPKGPCRSIVGDEDASVVGDKMICFSLERLSAKLNEFNYISELTALTAREVSHLSGLGEAEAYEVQQMVIHEVSNRVFYAEGESYQDTKSELKVILSDLNYLSGSLSSAPTEGFCALLGQLPGHYVSAYDKMEGVGTLLGPPETRDFLGLLIYKARYSVAFCNSSDPKPIEAGWRWSSQGDSYMPVNWWVGKPGRPVRLGTTPLRRVDPNDKAALARELSDLIQMTQVLDQELSRVRGPN